MNAGIGPNDPTIYYYDSDYPSPFDTLFPENFDETTEFQGIAFDLERYQELVTEQGGPVLELGCGTGRVAIPLARKGFEVTGVDVSQAMLESRGETVEVGDSGLVLPQLDALERGREPSRWPGLTTARTGTSGRVHPGSASQWRGAAGARGRGRTRCRGRRRPSGIRFRRASDRGLRDRGRGKSRLSGRRARGRAVEVTLAGSDVDKDHAKRGLLHIGLLAPTPSRSQYRTSRVRWPPPTLGSVGSNLECTPHGQNHGASG